MLVPLDHLHKREIWWCTPWHAIAVTRTQQASRTLVNMAPNRFLRLSEIMTSSGYFTGSFWTTCRQDQEQTRSVMSGESAVGHSCRVQDAWCTVWAAGSLMEGPRYRVQSVGETCRTLVGCRVQATRRMGLRILGLYMSQVLRGSARSIAHLKAGATLTECLLTPGLGKRARHSNSNKSDS